MDIIVNYLIESSLILGLLCIFYRFVLHYETNFTFNRFFLLFSLLMATVIPVISIGVQYSTGPSANVYTGNMLNAVTVYAQNTKEVIVPYVAQSSAFKWLYLVGCTGLIIRLLWGFIRLGGLAGKVKLMSFNDYKVADLPGQFNPFSFFNVVFVNQSRYSEDELEQIMIHELTHVRLKHSWDVLLLELLLIIQWFNPFAWLLRILLKELHEFQADKQVLSKGFSAKSYKELLLFQATGARLMPVNNFNQSLTKKRFTMMKKDNFQKILVLKPAMAIVTLILLSVMFACELREVEPSMSQKESEMKEAIENSMAGMPIKSASGEAYLIVEDMPEFPGGPEALKDFITNEVKYPADAKNAGISGRVYITFVIDEEGSVASSKIVRGSGYSILDEEALRVVNSMPKWKPGRINGENVKVSYTVPINFVLDGDPYPVTPMEVDEADMVHVKVKSFDRNTNSMQVEFPN